jgi:hypothetical protein
MLGNGFQDTSESGSQRETAASGVVFADLFFLQFSRGFICAGKPQDK